MNRNLQYSIYKGVTGKHGAAQFNFNPPHYIHKPTKRRLYSYQDLQSQSDKDEWKPRDGNIFLDITSTKAANVYNWEEKITVALNVADIGKVLLGLQSQGSTKIIHDPMAGSPQKGQITKTVEIYVQDRAKGCMLRCSQKEGENIRQHTVPMSADEVIILRTLLTRAVSQCLNW